jgi:hypothetical protein
MPPKRKSDAKKCPATSKASAKKVATRSSASSIVNKNPTTEDDTHDDTQRKSRLRHQLDSLHQEMEVAQYGTDTTGLQLRKKLRKAQSKSRTTKRRILEQQDREEYEYTADDGTTTRLRGSKAAAEDAVIQASLVLQPIPKKRQREDPTDDPVAAASDNDTTNNKLPNRPRKRRVTRMRNFKSHRLAERHGAALDAHARGHHRQALVKLKQIARGAPSAPQVYSSLGMVYSDMLRETQRKRNNALDVGEETQADVVGGEQIEADEARLESTMDSSQNGERVDEEEETEDVDEAEQDADVISTDIPDPALAEQLELAKKAYGSYHIAAILCKKDFNFWLQAADMALEISDIHFQAIALVPDDQKEHHSAERMRWQGEAKNDFQTADVLRPPGIDVPCKLASVMMDLGHLSEALTILTDLKKRSSAKGGRSEFETSYKAWLLYADLMLRIGFECEEWNKGILSTTNYMFRRWLRKHSGTFDWQERRLQALVMALEAAAGSKSCEKLVIWLKNRFNSRMSSDVKITDELNLSLDAMPQEVVDGDEQFEQEKALFVLKSKDELAAFDRTTTDMALLPGQEPFKERQKARCELVHQQQISLNVMHVEFHQKQGSDAIDKYTLTLPEPAVQKDELLPIAASLKSVCNIAFELMRHALNLDVFECGRLVGEATSTYLKERAHLIDKRLKIATDSGRDQGLFASAFNSQADAAPLHDQSDSEESFVFLSDDEEMEEERGSSFLQSMRMGVLPPQLSVLYGLCLLGEGGKDFLAYKCIKSVDSVEQENDTWKAEPLTGLTDYNSKWISFRELSTAPLGRSALYFYIANTVCKVGKEKEMAARLAPMFAKQIQFMSESGLIAALKDEKVCIYEKKDQARQVLAATSRYHLMMAVSSLSNSRIEEEAFIALEAAFEFILVALTTTWKVGADASVTSTSVSLIRDLALAFKLVLDCSIRLSERTNLFSTIQKIVSILGNKSYPLDATDEAKSVEWSNMHLSFAWLTASTRSLSIRALNLCCATCATHFSGWETQSFNLELMRRRRVPSFFGLSLDIVVAGPLGTTIEEDLASQWELAWNVVHASPPFSFRNKLSGIRDQLWYIESHEKLEKAMDSLTISHYGENNGLSVLLSFSRMCILLAEDTIDTNAKRNLVSFSLSILFPCVQFCLNERVWDCDIGLAQVGTAVVVDHWNTLTTFDENKRDEVLPPSRQPGFVRAGKRLATAEAAKTMTQSALSDFFAGENQSEPLSNINIIPCTTLLKEWNREEPQGAAISSGEATQMAKVSECTGLLRRCHTQNGVERASLNLSAALLDLASHDGCQNRFLCIQHATLFASQAAKLGKSDLPFKFALPDKRKCKSLEALVILGRAECLQAVYFCPEAAFLCCYVASVCRLHRDQANDLEWNARWSVLGALAYNVSVMIRYTAKSIMMDDQTKDDSNGGWNVDVVEELKLGRLDGVSLKQTTDKSAVGEAVLERQISNSSIAEHAFDEFGSERFTAPSAFSDNAGFAIAESKRIGAYAEV